MKSASCPVSSRQRSWQADFYFPLSIQKLYRPGHIRSGIFIDIGSMKKNFMQSFRGITKGEACK